MSIAQDERAGLAADLSRLGPDAPTLCKGWTARDLLTHLLLRENDPLAVPGRSVLHHGGHQPSVITAQPCRDCGGQGWFFSLHAPH